MGERASETAVPFTNGSDSLEGAGHSVLGLLERAAGMAEKTSNMREALLKTFRVSFNPPKSKYRN
jgi:hypothetical protein